MSVSTSGGSVDATDDSAITRVLRETERSAIRARNGIRYLAGAEWAPTRPTPSDVVWHQGTAELRRYRSDSVRFRDPVVMFIGLVSRSYILDLHRQNSVARALVDAGLDVYLLDWGEPTPADAVNTLETYALRYLPRALRVALQTSKSERANVFGYCMGGNLALLALAAQRLPVGSLVTMATPVDFTQLPGLAGAFRERDVDADRLVDWTGNVPPQYLSAFFRARKPTSDIPNFARLWENLWNDEFVESHQAMARWAREHIAFPGAAFRQVADQWLRHNGFMEGRLVLGGRRLDLRNVDCPTFSLLALRDDLVPPASARPIGSLLGADEFELVELEAGHAGLTTSRKAATTTMPALKRWLVDHNTQIKE